MSARLPLTPDREFQIRPTRRQFAAIVPLLAVLAATLAHQVRADGHHAANVPLLPAYRQECASCHIAYPPGMLPAASWQRLMQNLPHHFGTDASLEPATTQQLAAWLAGNGGTFKRVRAEPAQERISRSDWFIRKHREVTAATWKLPAVRSPANCTACHTQADQGDFNEHRVRIPR